LNDGEEEECAPEAVKLLIACAPEMARMLLRCLEESPPTDEEVEALLRKAGVR
jgi:hypothetical protein